MGMVETADLWWKNAVIYSLDVQTFADSNGDGVGDFQGLIENIDHLAGLGVTCIWLMPFFPTPDLDDGYDISDYYGVDPRLGSLGDFTEFIAVAQDRGLRVIADLVVNHTSSEHPWFRSSRSSPDSPYRDFYVWRDEVPEDGPKGLVFPGEQKELWTFDEEAGQYYLHRFYHHQPDLNVASPEVRREMRKIIGFWMAQGLSGFRVDAVPFLLELDGIDGEMETPPHDFLRDLRAFIGRRRGDAVLLGEVNLPPAQQREFFGDDDGDEMQVLFDFNGMQATYLAFARQDARPLVEALRNRCEVPDENAFATFLRNHDELTLDKLTDDERNEVFAAFGPDPDMQVYDRGLRRRLPSMLDGDQECLRMAYSLMFSMPGTPTIFYGEEIGMAENLAIDGRRAVRSPMQWRSTPSAGFSDAPPDQLTRPIPDDERFAPAAVNVEDQRADPDSLLNWFERLVRMRKDLPEVGLGRWDLLDAGDHSVIAIRYRWEGREVLAVHNVAARRIEVSIDVGDDRTTHDLLPFGSHHPPSNSEHGVITLELLPYGYRWIRLEEA